MAAGAICRRRRSACAPLMLTRMPQDAFARREAALIDENARMAPDMLMMPWIDERLPSSASRRIAASEMPELMMFTMPRP